MKTIFSIRHLTITAPFLLTLLLAISCTTSNQNTKQEDAAQLNGELIIFHAGSLSLPFKEISRQFEALNPGTKVLLESSGSVDCARKITELKKPCDLMASSDYKVIEKFLIPEYTGWHIPFVSNEMVIAYHRASRQADKINGDNWFEILSLEEVRYGRSDPKSDPCGYRTIMVLDLAENHYQAEGIAKGLQDKDSRYIRPKEVDLLALLEVGEIDYFFVYRSVAIQHKLDYIELPDEINLKSPDFGELYNSVSVDIPGNSPGDWVTIHGEPMVYSITMLDDAPNRSLAIAFLQFLLNSEKGMREMEMMGQKSVIPAKSHFYQEVPDGLKQFVRE